MTSEELKRLTVLDRRRENLERSLSEFRKGDKGEDIRDILDSEDFSIIRQAANVAAEKKIEELLRETKAQLDTGLGVAA